VSLHESLPPGCEPDCHGCRHRHLTLAASLAQKQAYLARVLAPWGDRLDAVHSAGPQARLAYRDRVTLNARWDDVRGWRFGLMRRDELIAIHDCPVHTPRVNRLVRCLREHAPAAPVFPLAYLHVAGAQATLIVKSRDVPASALASLCAAVGAVGLEGLWLHLHPSAGRKLFARSGWRLLWGAPTSRDADGCVHGPTAFQQLLPQLHDAALELVTAHLAPGPDVAVLDLYCGLGASLRRWTAHGATALGVELAGGAVACVAHNAPSAHVLRGTCVQRLPQVRDWWREHARAGRRVAYVNPPRSGLEPDVVAALAGELRPDRIGYLSCSAGTLARDLAAFEQAGYVVRRLAPFDFFPGTHHVECLALLERSSPHAARP
jgi:tRNA/tmRNA/rRNA uracil-C5-methylase (TrmA/RlmC/RlmD family)